MDIKKIVEGKRLRYSVKHRLGATEGIGKVTRMYATVTGMRVVLSDKANNRDITARPSQLKSA